MEVEQQSHFSCCSSHVAKGQKQPGPEKLNMFAVFQGKRRRSRLVTAKEARKKKNQGRFCMSTGVVSYDVKCQLALFMVSMNAHYTMDE